MSVDGSHEYTREVSTVNEDEGWRVAIYRFGEEWINVGRDFWNICKWSSFSFLKHLNHGIWLLIIIGCDNCR